MHCLVDDALAELKGLEVSSHSVFPHIHKVPCPPKKAMLKTKFYNQIYQQVLPGQLSGAYHVGAGLQCEA